MYIVYKITNKINDKKYIGISSRPVSERLNEHFSRAKCGQRKSRLYDAIRKYGADSFIAEVVCSTECSDEVRSLETKYIQEYNSFDNGYNCNLGGCGFLEFPMHIREKIRVASIGKKMSEEAKKKMSDSKKMLTGQGKNLGAYIGESSPLAKHYRIQRPEGTIEIIKGIRKYCRDNNILHCKLNAGKTKGFVLLERLNDYPEREYTQAGGSAHLPIR